jgi:hypothetical protein
MYKDRGTKTCVSVPRPPRAKNPQAYSRVTIEVDPPMVAEWDAFCCEFDIPLSDAIDAAMELLIAETRKQEASAKRSEEEDHQEFIRRVS